MLELEGVVEGVLDQSDNGVVRLGPGDEKVAVVLGDFLHEDGFLKLGDPHAAS